MSASAEPLKAPFPWFGGKSRAASLLWPRFGDVANYVEPFFGSGAVLLARPHAPRIETVNDVDALLCNFWRSIRLSPEATAEHADGPVDESDLHSKHRWLVNRKPQIRELIQSDAEAHDPKIAGWWVWGLCAWIGSGWCSAEAGGEVSEQMPFLGGFVDQQGHGIHHVSTRSRILETFQALSARLRGVRVACGDFERILSDSVTWRHGATAVLLDPPYADGEEVYSAGDDARGTFARAAAWAAEHGADQRLRVALCGYEGTWSPPAGWSTIAWKAKGGYGGQRGEGKAKNDNAARERIWCSPGCLRVDAVDNAGPLFTRQQEAQAAE